MVRGTGAAPLLHGKLELSLADAIQMGLENNLSVEVDRYAPVIAGLDEGIAWGAFDPELFAEIGHTDADVPSGSAIITGGWRSATASTWWMGATGSVRC